MTTLLYVDDDADMAAEVEHALRGRDYVVTTAGSYEQALSAIGQTDFDVVMTDVRMPGPSGLALCRRIVDDRPGTPVIVSTAFGSMDTAIDAIRAGAFDFVVKPFDVEQLLVAVGRAAEVGALRREVTRLRREVQGGRFEEMLGESAPMRELFDLVARVAETDATVLVTGESGSGKELVARAIHARSRRAAGPLVTINCAAMPEALLEAELFGHTKGAYTDAKTARRGLFLDASGGTLFLDELGEMPLPMQAKLLRAIEQRKVRPVGASAEVDVDVRIVAATNRDLEEMVRARQFREDLFYRVSVVHLDVPPLRRRENDVLLLAAHFVKKLAARHDRLVRGFSADVAARLLAYPFPGNVRELSNTIERAVALARRDELGVDDLPPKLRQSTPLPGAPSAAATPLVTLEQLEAEHIARVMAAVGWNKSEATAVLGIDRSTLYRKLDRYGVAPPKALPDSAASRTTCTSSLAVIGFSRTAYAFSWAARARARSSANPVTSTTGTGHSASRSAVRSSTPECRGIRTSITITSGGAIVRPAAAEKSLSIS
jgi:two-component system response regulator HydG